jgi:hypothetical protein
VEEFWIILGSLAGVVTAAVTIWLVILARRPASSPASSAAEPTAKEEPDVEVTVANLFEAFEQPRDLGPWSFSTSPSASPTSKRQPPSTRRSHQRPASRSGAKPMTVPASLSARQTDLSP